MNKEINLVKTKLKTLLNQAKNLSTKNKVILMIALIAIAIGTVFAISFLTSTKQQNFATQKDQFASTCSLPKIDFKESAFSIGVPKGWLHEINNGTIAIMEDNSNTTAAFLYTARLKQDLSAKQFLQQFADVFKKAIKDAGGNLTLNKILEEGEIASATAKATVEEGELTGKFEVAKDDGFVTLKVYWAPVDEFNKKEPILKNVVGCFMRHKVLSEDVLAAAKSYNDKTQPVQLKSYTGNYFKILMPDGFKITGETDSGIDISREDNQVGFSYAYVTGAQGPYTPKSWASQTLPQAGISNVNLNNGVTIPSPMQGYSIKEFDFTGTLAGKQVQGKITVGIYNTPDFGFGQSSSAFAAIQVAAQDTWANVASTLKQMQNSVQIIDIGSRKNIVLPPNRPIETTGGDSITSSSSYASSVNDQTSENWSEAMRGYEEVESPSTSTKYDVPLNSWDPSGPDGAGYYRALPGGGLEKLTQL